MLPGPGLGQRHKPGGDALPPELGQDGHAVDEILTHRGFFQVSQG